MCPFWKVKLRFSAFRCFMAWSAVSDSWQSSGDLPWSACLVSMFDSMWFRPGANALCSKKPAGMLPIVHSMGNIQRFVSWFWCVGSGVRGHELLLSRWREAEAQRILVERGLWFAATLSAIFLGNVLSHAFSGRMLNSCACKAGHGP